MGYDILFYMYLKLIVIEPKMKQAAEKSPENGELAALSRELTELVEFCAHNDNSMMLDDSTCFPTLRPKKKLRFNRIPIPKNPKLPKLHLPRHLRELRMCHDVSREELSGYLGVSCETYDRYESGELEPSIQSLRLLAILYHEYIDDLV